MAHAQAQLHSYRVTYHLNFWVWDSNRHAKMQQIKQIKWQLSGWR